MVPKQWSAFSQRPCENEMCSPERKINRIQAFFGPCRMTGSLPPLHILREPGMSVLRVNVGRTLVARLLLLVGLVFACNILLQLILSAELVLVCIKLSNSYINRIEWAWSIFSDLCDALTASFEGLTPTRWTKPEHYGIKLNVFQPRFNVWCVLRDGDAGNT